MRPSLVGGAILAVATALMILVGEAFGFGLNQVALLGGALGAALGLVPDRTLLQRAGGFVAGFLLAWLGYALRAGFLPDISAGRALAAIIVVGLCVVVVFVAMGRLPLWSLLLGVAALVGAYEETYTAAPARFVEQSASAATAVLLAAAVGFLATAFVGPPVVEDEAAPRRTRRRSTSPAAAEPPAEEEETRLDEIMTPKEPQS
jgi:hypothetical protein